MKKVIVLGVLFCFAFSMTAQAKDVWEMANSDQYGEKVGGMLGRGLFNAVTCFVDIPVQTVAGTKKMKPEFMGAVSGFGSGCVCTVLRASSGVLDVATSWIPNFHGLPVSRSYENCLAAEATESTYVAPTTTVYQPAPSPKPDSEDRMKYVKK